MPKKMRQDLLKFLGCIELNLLQVEIRTAVEEQFADSKFCEFINELFKEDEPMMEITKQQHDSFALLYSECKAPEKFFYAVPVAVALPL